MQAATLDLDLFGSVWIVLHLLCNLLVLFESLQVKHVVVLVLAELQGRVKHIQSVLGLLDHIHFDLSLGKEHVSCLILSSFFLDEYLTLLDNLHELTCIIQRLKLL